MKVVRNKTTVGHAHIITNVDLHSWKKLMAKRQNLRENSISYNHGQKLMAKRQNLRENSIS